MLKLLPNIHEFDGDAAEYLLGIYSLGGYVKGQDAMFDPRKVLVNPKDWKAITETVIKKGGPTAGFFFMNYGPSTDESVPEGKVRILSQVKESLK